MLILSESVRLLWQLLQLFSASSYSNFGFNFVFCVSPHRLVWCIWAQAPQAPEIPPRNACFCLTLPHRPANIHGGEVQRDS